MQMQRAHTRRAGLQGRTAAKEVLPLVAAPAAASQQGREGACQGGISTTRRLVSQADAPAQQLQKH